MAGHKTIVEALRAHGGLADNERVYSVKVPSQPPVFVVSNSLGNAALAVVKASTVTQKEINAALTKEVLEKEEDRGD